MMMSLVVWAMLTCVATDGLLSGLIQKNDDPLKSSMGTNNRDEAKKMEPTAIASKYGPEYFPNEHQPPEEWWQEFQFSFDESAYGEITSIRWETNYHGSWQTLAINNGYQRAHMDGTLEYSCQVRVVVCYFSAGQTEQVTSNELTIGNGEPTQVQQGTHPGEYYGVCN